MRNLFLALVLANVGFAVWQFGRSEPEAREIERETPGIRLMSEVAESEAASTEAVASAPGPESAPQAGDAAAAAPGDAAAHGEAAAARAGETARGDVVGGDAAAVTQTPEVPSDTAPSAEAAAPGEADTAPAANAEGVCRSVGPFEELSQAAVAASTLREQGYEPEQRVAEGEIWVGYWVYLEGIASSEAADEALADLAGAGIPEAYLISGAEPGGDLISIGVFTEASRAERVADEVRDLGYEPSVTGRTRRGRVYWVDVEAGAALDLERLQPSGRIVRLEQRPCP